MHIRARQDSDLEQLEVVARRVQAADRYPIHLPDDDARRFLTEPASASAWVGTVDEQVVGHVVLNDATSEPAMRAIEGLGDPRPPVYVARLLVDPSARRTGAGRALLDHARREALRMRRLPALDVVDIPTAAPAIALYRAEGWQEVTRVAFTLAGNELEEIVFVGPEGADG